MLPADYDPANSDPGKLGLPLTYVAGERALVITRSGWDRDALLLNLHVRGVNGGHPYADRNSIVFAGKGRVWSGLNQWLPDNDQQSLVTIDDWSQDALTPARLTNVTDQPLATFAVGDASYCWNWHLSRIDTNPATHRPYTRAELGDGTTPPANGGSWERHSYNDFAFSKVATPSADDPLYLLKSWIGLPGVITPMARTKNQSVVKAYRTVGVIRGAHPYALVIDDIQADMTCHTYDWRLIMEKDLVIESVQPSTQSPGSMCDVTIIAKEFLVSNPDKIAAASVKISATDPKLLVRILRCDQADPHAKLEPTMAESKKKDNNIFSLKVSSIEPRFMIMLYPYRPGEPVPMTTWNADHTALVVDFQEYQDHINISLSPSGKTDVVITRTERGKTSVLAEMNQPVKILSGNP